MQSLPNRPDIGALPKIAGGDFGNLIDYPQFVADDCFQIFISFHFDRDSDLSGLAESGLAAFYSGGRTASSEVTAPTGLTAAHGTLPFGTRVLVTNLRNGKTVVVRIVDRGPYGRGRVIDLSRAAARELDMISAGTTMVSIERQ